MAQFKKKKKKSLIQTKDSGNRYLPRARMVKMSLFPLKVTFVHHSFLMCQGYKILNDREPCLFLLISWDWANTWHSGCLISSYGTKSEVAGHCMSSSVSQDLKAEKWGHLLKHRTQGPHVRETFHHSWLFFSLSELYTGQVPRHCVLNYDLVIWAAVFLGVISCYVTKHPPA